MWLTVDITVQSWQTHKSATKMFLVWNRGKRCAAAMSEHQRLEIHWHNGHPDIRQTAYFAPQINPPLAKVAIKPVVRSCVECQSINQSSTSALKEGEIQCRHEHVLSLHSSRTITPWGKPSNL